MPLLSGLEAGQRIKHNLPAVKLIFMTMYDDPYLVGEAFRAGGSAFLLKEAAASELITAIEHALRGGSYVTPSIREGLRQMELRKPQAREKRPEPSVRQREVIQLLARGRTLKEVAQELNIKPRTAAGHKYALMEALELKTSADVVKYAVQHGIISLPQDSLSIDGSLRGHRTSH